MKAKDDELWQTAKHRAETTDAAFWEAFEGSGCRTIFQVPYRTLALDRSDPRIAEGLRISKAAILELRDAVEASGAEYLAVIIPTKEFTFAEVAHGSDNYRRLASLEGSLHSDLAEHLQRHRVRFIDATGALRDAVAHGRQPFRVDQDGHLNAIGQEVIAREVAHALST